MATIFVTYDLTEPGKNYAKVTQFLTGIGARRVLLSVWAIRGDYRVLELRDQLWKLVDATDRILVVQTKEDWASFNALVDVNQL